MQCATHPGVETELRCATCGKPICPDCLVETPVGMKCREHGLNPTPPVYRVTLAGYGAAVPAGLVLSAVAGAVALRFRYLILLLVLGVVAGRLIGEAMSFSSGWKRGPRLAAVAAATVAVGTVIGGSLLVRLWYGFPPVSAGDLLQGILAVPLLWVFGAFAAVTAYWRIR